MTNRTGKITQLERVFQVMHYWGGWMSLCEIKDHIYARYDHLDSECAISARIREIGTARCAKYPEMAGYTVNKDRMVGRNAYLYRLMRVPG